MRQILLIIILITIMNKVDAQDQSTIAIADTGRIARTEKKYKELFGAPVVLNATDPELMTILQRFIFGEIFYTGNLDDKTRELITITALATNQTLPQLKAIHFSSIKKCYTLFNCCTKQHYHFLVAFWHTIRPTHAHTTKPKCRDFQPAVSKFSFL